MTGNGDRSHPPVSQAPPRQFRRIVVALAVLLVVSVWGFFGAGHTGLALAIVSLFIAMVVTLSLVLMHIARRDEPNAGTGNSETLRDWLDREFDDYTGRIKASSAAIEILLPLVAVAFGMTLFALVHYFDRVI